MKDNIFWQIVAGVVPQPNAARLLGWNFVSHDPKKDEVRVQFDASESLTNALGKVHGGMLTAMLDDCLGPAIYATLDTYEVALTVEMKTTFLRAVSPGQILGIARMSRRDGDYCYAEGELRNTKNKTLVTASACYKVICLNQRD